MGINNNKVRNIAMLVTFTQALGCASLDPGTFEEIMVGPYKVDGRNTMNMVDMAINEHSGIKPTREEACSQADRNGDYVIIYDEACGLFRFYKKNY